LAGLCLRLTTDTEQPHIRHEALNLRLVADEPSMLVEQPESLTVDEYRRPKVTGRVELASFDIPPCFG
jgi:hypothetical protein